VKTLIAVLVLIGAVAVGAGGYWLGRNASAPPSAAPGVTVTDAAVAAAPKARKLLYYRNPMGLADTSPVPKKDSMGMDYIAVYEGEDESAASAGPAASNALRISTEKIQKLGVRTERATMQSLGRSVRAVGRVEADERRVYAVTAKFEGFVERLHVGATGQPVARGQTLFDAYSPELVSAQREYAIAMQGVDATRDAGPEAQSSMKRLAESSLARLRNWDLPADQIAALVRSGEARRSIAFPSPVSGVVTEKKAQQGLRFMPGDVLYQVTDLSSVWVIADLPEQDIALVRTGSRARVTTTAQAGGEALEGRVAYVYPTMKAETRSIPVRIELANPGGRLKPAMFAQVEFAVGADAPVLTVPDSAVIDTGTRRLVLVQVGEGRFEPREVELGARGDNRVEVRRGVREGEAVVVAANFLIDAESNLRAAVAGMAGRDGAVAPAAPASMSTSTAARPASAAALAPSGAAKAAHVGH
jgi:Cu(I)/Ag(I) efflux system membrane fusion protein